MPKANDDSQFDHNLSEVNKNKKSVSVPVSVNAPMIEKLAKEQAYKAPSQIKGKIPGGE